MTAPTRRGLGRQFAGHDPQSRAYGVREYLAPKVVRRDTFWAMPSGSFPLDQGAEGACTGYGVSHELAAGPVIMPGVNQAYAEQRYRRNREVDAQLGNHFDDGATTLACMKAAQADGLISGYRWAFGIDDAVDTLCSVGPVCFGIPWYERMYTTTGLGQVVKGGALAGGHFITGVGYVEHPTWGPCVLWLNTWGDSYGIGYPALNVRHGVGIVRVPTLAALLGEQGEAVIPADFLPAAPVSPVPSPDRKPTRRRRWWQFGG